MSIKSIFCKFGEIEDALADLEPLSKPEYNQQNDICLARLFSDLFKSVARYNSTAKEWYIYDGQVWRRDVGNMETEKLAKKFADALYIHSVDAEQHFRTYITKLGDRYRRKTLIEDARDFNFLTSDLLDAHPELINCQNGVINLTTLKLMDHDPDLLLSKITNVVYQPDAISEDFETFIRQIMCDDTDQIHYLQKLFGYALTSETKYEEFYLLFGSTTRNGKGTLISTIMHMLGDYSTNMLPESLAQCKRDSRSASGDIARLKGCRFLNVSEPPKGMLFNVQLLKTMTGRDVITARHLHEREIEFVPEFKLFINSNFLPMVNDDTLFKSNRVHVIPFNRHFEEDEQDKGLKDRLAQEDNISGIFNWCLAGLDAYYKEGLTPPDAVVKATDEYRDKSDKVGCFLIECMIETGNNTKAMDAYQAYSRWCRANGYCPENKGNFFSDLKSRGIFASSGSVNGSTVRNIIKGYELDPDFMDGWTRIRDDFEDA